MCHLTRQSRLPQHVYQGHSSKKNELEIARDAFKSQVRLRVASSLPPTFPRPEVSSWPCLIAEEAAVESVNAEPCPVKIGKGVNAHSLIL